MPLTRELDGFLWPSFFPEENFGLIKDLQFRAEDTILSTYPKCGTNWVAYIVWSILHPEEPAPDTKTVLRDFVFGDMMGLGRWADTPEDQGRMIFTHVPFDRLQMNASTKFLCIVRNPLDCCVSYFHFIKNAGGGNYTDEEGQEIQTTFFEDFVKGVVPFGSYFKHVKDAYNRRHDKNIHFMVYEKMKANPREETLRLAKFLGAEKPLEANGGELLDKVVEQSSFTVMKKNFTYKSPKDGKIVNMLRKGQAGGYKDSLTSSQIDILRELMRKELAGTELLEFWENI